MPETSAMGTRVEQPSELVPCASRTGYRQPKDLADPFYRLSPAVEDLHVIVPRGNWPVLLQNGFCIILLVLTTLGVKSSYLLRAPCNRPVTCENGAVEDRSPRRPLVV